MIGSDSDPNFTYLVNYSTSYSFSGRSTRNKKLKKAAAVAEAGAKRKRAQTGYTMFVQENYESIKKANAAAIPGDGIKQQSREILSTLARHWGQVDDEEKRAWQEKAAGANGNRDDISGLQCTESMEEIEQPEPTEDWGSMKRAARKAPPNADAKDGSAQV